MVRAALDQSEPSPRFASTGIHTKSETGNLQGKGLEKGPGDSQVPIRRGSQKTRVSQSLEHLLEDESTNLASFS